jgi:predicted DNA-binding transcriptional regulator AlpA
MEILLSPKTAAKALGLSLKTLEAMRVRGNGPKFIKISSRKVVYSETHLKEWISDRIFSSTSEYKH